MKSNIKYLLFLIPILLLLFTGCSKKEYSVTFENDILDTSKKVTVVKGNSVTKPNDPTIEGYLFVAWMKDGKKFDFNTKITEDIVLQASFEEDKLTYIDTCKVTFDTDGGNKLNDIIISKGDTIVEPTEPTKENYKFLYWMKDSEKFDFNTKITEDVTLIAKYENVTKYKVTFKDDNNVTVKLYNPGEELGELDIPVKEGYTFIGWHNDIVKVNKTTKVTGDIVLQAKWNENKKTYTVALVDSAYLVVLENGIKTTNISAIYTTSDVLISNTIVEGRFSITDASLFNNNTQFKIILSNNNDVYANKTSI